MLTLKLLKEETDHVIKGLEKKHFADARQAVEKALDIDKRRRDTQGRLDNLLSESKKMASQIGQFMKQGQKEAAENAKQAVSKLKEEITILQSSLKQYEEELVRHLCTIPNIPNDDVPEGVNAEDNVVVKEGGVKPVLGANALPHWDLAKKYNLIDFELGSKVSGAGFPFYIGKMARFQRALESFFLEEARKHGYLEVQPPLLVNPSSGYGTGQLPDKEGQMYHAEVDDLYLIPTAEVPVTNIFRDVIIEEKDLPIKRCAYSACFRREAGAYGKDVRGLNRLHEFDKVEIVRIDTPSHSYESLKEMLNHVEGLLQKLELPYRILRLCSRYRTDPHSGSRLSGLPYRFFRSLKDRSDRDLPPPLQR